MSSSMQYIIGTVVFCNSGYILNSYIHCDIMLRYSRISLIIHADKDINTYISSYNSSQYDCMFMNTMHFIVSGLRSGDKSTFTIKDLLDSILVKDAHTKELHDIIYTYIPRHSFVCKYIPNEHYKHIKQNNDVLHEQIYQRLYS